jgi:hypothetical protein
MRKSYGCFPLQSFWSIHSTAQSTDVIHEPPGLTNLRINKRIHGTAWKKIIKVVFRREKFSDGSSLGRYVFGSEISYNKAPPRLPGLAC